MDEANEASDDQSEEWPPRENRLQAIRWRAETHLERDEFYAASTALAEAFALVGADEDELFRGLHHLAAAGYRHQLGEPVRAARQLKHARRRLAAFPEYGEPVRAVERLLES
jgi:hypothetical protein